MKLSCSIERSAALVLKHKLEQTAPDQQQKFMDMIDAFNVWLPFYDTANLTIYANAEHTRSVLYLFRIIDCSAQVENHDADAVPQDHVIGVLDKPPSTREYARLFPIDEFDLAMCSNNENIIDAPLTQQTGKRLGC